MGFCLLKGSDRFSCVQVEGKLVIVVTVVVVVFAAVVFVVFVVVVVVADVFVVAFAVVVFVDVFLRLLLLQICQFFIVPVCECWVYWVSCRCFCGCFCGCC